MMPSELQQEALRDLRFCAGQLRHLYTIVFAGRTTKHEELARGLISPEVARIEGLIAKLEAL